MDKQLIVKGLLVNYILAKGGSGNTLLFLHGWRSNAEVWQKIISNAQYPIATFYAVDLPGFGKSETPSTSMTVSDYAAIVGEFIKKLELKNVILVGHSFGGRIGIKLAATQPGLIDKLVLLDSAGFAMPSPRKNLYRSVAKIVKPVFGPKFMQDLRKKIYKQLGAEDYLATPQLQQTFVNIVSEDLSADMKNINCPTLIINGENDKDTPVEFGEKMHSLISNSQFLILKNAGHFSFSDQPEEFIKNLNEFIEQ